MRDERPGDRTNPRDQTSPKAENNPGNDGSTGPRLDDGSPPRDPDELYEVLANARRRRLLSYLLSRSDDTVTVDDVVDAVAERESPDPGPGTHRDRVAADVHHVHLPRLADAGVVDFDPVTETVEYDGSEMLEALLATTGAMGDEGGDLR